MGGVAQKGLIGGLPAGELTAGIGSRSPRKMRPQEQIEDTHDGSIVWLGGEGHARGDLRLTLPRPKGRGGTPKMAFA